MKAHLVVVIAAVALAGASGAVLAQSSRSIWDGAYTTAQAVRGKTAYANNCSRCHGSSLEGNDEIPALAGAHLMVDFDGQTAGDLVHRIQTTMPLDNPGTLNMATVTDIAYLHFAVERSSGWKHRTACGPVGADPDPFRRRKTQLQVNFRN